MSNLKENINQIDSVVQGKVISKDGTTIGYQSIGKGPSVIVLPGVLGTSDDFTKFAEELSDSFTVHVIDRRGRGISGPQGEEYSIEKECEDVEAVQTATGATYVFGHSFGGFLALETARRYNTFYKMALYEPGVSVNNSIPMEWIPEFEEALNKSDYAGAFLAFSKPHVKAFQIMPAWLGKILMRSMLRSEFGNKVKKLMPTMIKEHRAEQLLDSTFNNYREIKADALLISGGKREEWAYKAIQVLEQTIPSTKTVMLPKLNHLAPVNNYSPLEVARCVKRYFLD